MFIQTRNRVIDKKMLRLLSFSRPSVYIKQSKKKTPNKYLLLASRNFNRDIFVFLCGIFSCWIILFYKELYILDTLSSIRVKMESEIEFRFIGC